MKLSELRSLDFSDLGGWPVAAKAILILLVCAALLGAGYWFDTRHQLEGLNRVRAEEPGLQQQLANKWKKAANLQAYQQQMEQIKETFGMLLRQLPDKAEIAALLVDISETGLASGLEFDLFKPDAEILREFYAEKPIQIRVKGTYHEFGEFVSGVSNLPRIVTMHNFDMVPEKGQGTDGERLLGMNITAKTYRYVDEEELAERAAQAKAAKAPKRKKK